MREKLQNVCLVIGAVGITTFIAGLTWLAVASADIPAKLVIGGLITTVVAFATSAFI